MSGVVPVSRSRGVRHESTADYARVIEVPRKRWTTRDADFFGVERPAEAPEFIQDRAYSSPIWYEAEMRPST